MGIKKIINHISIIIVVFFIIQLIPGTLANIDGFLSHTDKSKSTLTSGIISNDILVTGRINLKPTFLKVTSKSCFYNLVPLPGIGNIKSDSFFKEQLFDYRKSIRQFILLHFHGGKYKNNYCAI